MHWIDDIVLGLIDMYSTNDPYELCDLLNIKIKKVSPNSLILASNNSLYIRNYYGEEIIYIKNDLSLSIEKFYISHELGHAILHPDIKNSLNSNLINIDKLEKQANYFAFRLRKIQFNEIELHQLTLEQIASCVEVPFHALKQLVNI